MVYTWDSWSQTGYVCILKKNKMWFVPGDVVPIINLQKLLK